MATTINYEQFLARAKQLAFAGGDARSSAVIDSALTAEVIAPLALRNLCTKKLQSPEGRAQLRTNFDLVFSAGLAPIPAGSTLPDGAILDLYILLDGTQTDYEVSYLPQKFDKSAKLFNWMYYYWVDTEGVIGMASGDGVPKDGTVVANAPLIPVPPTGTGGNLTASKAIIEEAIALIASVLRGDTPIALLNGTM